MDTFSRESNRCIDKTNENFPFSIETTLENQQGLSDTTKMGGAVVWKQTKLSYNEARILSWLRDKKELWMSVYDVVDN